MASNTPWILRASDPVWREDHDYKKGHRICGSDGAIYIARQDSGPNTAVGVQNPVTETSGDYWISLANSLKSGGANELTGATTAKKLETPRVIDGVAFDGTTDISNYAVCATQSSAAEKAVSIAGFNLVAGASARIRFTNGNTHTTPTLNISDTGAYELRYNNEAIKDYYIDKNGTYDVVYDGAYYQIVNGGTTQQTPKALQLTNKRSIYGVGFDGTDDVYNFTVCEDNADTVDKNVSLPGFVLAKGAIIKVKFANGSTCTAPTLNINKIGAKSIKWNDEDLKSYFIDANGIYEFIFDGTNFQLVNGGPTVTSPSAKKLEDPRAINGVAFDGTGNISNFGVCSTSDDKFTKVVTISGYQLVPGASACVQFVNGNSTTTPTLNINGTGDIPIKNNGNNLENDAIVKNGIYNIVYDGTCYQIVNGGVATKASAATKLTDARSINGIQFDGTADVLTYGVCSTAADTVSKTVSIDNFVLTRGAKVTIKFARGNTCNAPTLNINNTGAKILKYNDLSLQSYYIEANSTFDIVYDGTYYQLVGSVNGSSSVTTITNNTNITNISTPGEYVITNGSVATSNGYPYDATEKNISLKVYVGKDANQACQVLHIDKSEWHRFSTDGGKTWQGWRPIGGSITDLGTVYLDLNGDDANTGLSVNKPVRTLARALEICRAVHLVEKTYAKCTANMSTRSTDHGYCVLSFGAGNWGKIQLADLDFNIVIKGTKYNVDQNAYSSDMPYFNVLNIFRCRAVDFCGITFGKVYAVGNGTVIYQAGYIRCRSICMREYAQFVIPFTHCLDIYDYTVDYLDSESVDAEKNSVFYLSAGGKIVSYWARTGQQKVRVVSNISLGTDGRFLYCTEIDSRFATACNFINNLQVNSGCTVTGSKYYICNHDMDYPGITKAQADMLPGTAAGTYACGRIVIAEAHSGTQWWRKWSDGWIEQGGRVNNWLPSKQYDWYTFNFNTAFTSESTINLSLTVSRVGAVAVSGNAVDDTTVTEVKRTISNCTVNAFDWGYTNGCTSMSKLSFYWIAYGY